MGCKLGLKNIKLLKEIYIQCLKKSYCLCISCLTFLTLIGCLVLAFFFFLSLRKPTPFKCEEKRIITPLLPAHFSLCGKSGKIIEQN